MRQKKVFSMSQPVQLVCALNLLLSFFSYNNFFKYKMDGDQN